MHIPDGFLEARVWAPAWLVSAGGLAWCFRRVSAVLKDRMIPLMGVMAAFIFSAQMLNFPVMTGTSGHLLGGVLAAVLLGPFAGAVVLAIVLAVQCLIFQDGGLTALGANILNMAFVGTLGGYGVFRMLRTFAGKRIGLVSGAGIAAWFSVVLASAACSVELAASGISPLKIILPAMAGVHAVIGIGEAVITGMVVGFVSKVRPDLIYSPGKERAA